MTALRTAAQQALEALEWHYHQGHSNTLGGLRLKIDEKALRNLRAALAQQAEPVQDQDVEDAIEAAYWQFDCRKKGLNEWASAPQSERDAFKAEARKLVRGYFPTRQAQDTKREMLVVADAFIRGKRAALTQQAEPVEPITRLFGTLPVHDAQQTEPTVPSDCADSHQPAQAEPVEPVAGVVLNEEGRAALVEHGREEWHCAARNARRLYTAPPQRKPLTIERLRDALVASRIIPPAAVEDPDGYDDGVTLFRIEALHRRIT